MIIFGIILSFILCILINSRTPTQCNKLYDIIKILTRQAARWSIAASQDENILIAVLHANYGTGYLWALKDIATEDQIRKASGIDMIKFTKNITDIQDYVTKRAVIQCPNYNIGSGYLAKIAGEG